MKSDKKITLGLISMTTLAGLGIIGSTAGSLAWYAYSSSTRISFVGTSVAKSLLLNVGIVDNNHVVSNEKLEEFNMVREEVDGKSVIFSKSANGLDYRVIALFLDNSGRASNQLFPLTTRSIAKNLNPNDPFKLYKAPNYGEVDFTADAEPNEFVEIPFAFKVDTVGTMGIVSTDVWLTDSSISASGQDIHQAVRIYINNGQRSFIFKPADKTMTDGATNVGGLLDLEGDGTYDYDKLTQQEYYYGECNTDPDDFVYSAEEYGKTYDEAPFDNVNHVTNTSAKSTFYAKHNFEAYTLDLTDIVPLTANYHSFGTVKPMTDINGNHYEGATGYKIATTSPTSGVGYATFVIYIEGWDHVVIDKAVGYQFTLGLTFEMNRL